MKLKSLKVTGAYGYLNLNFQFKQDLTFLIGINGSGKTTALKLIEAILTPSPQILDKIPHTSAELVLATGRRLTKIITQVTNRETTIAISAAGEKISLTYPHPDISDANRSPPDEGRDPYGILLAQISHHPVIVFLRDKLDTPLFLGIDRKNIAIHFGLSDDRPQNMQRARQRAMHLHAMQRRMPISGQLGSSLVDVQLMIQEIYKKTAEGQMKFSSQLQESIFLDAFDYQPGGGFFKALRKNEDASNYLVSIIKKKNDVGIALKNSGVAKDKYQLVVAKFFTHIEALLKKAMASENQTSLDSGAISDVSIELAFNKPVVDRVLKLIDASETYNKSHKQLWGPINDFLSLVNKFLIDSGKELVIDQVGWLSVRVEGGELRSLDVLSSGERQIVVIFGHLAINRELNRAGIFIIDEPELSLHLKWQEIFVDSLLTVSPNNQFVLATHSPAIVLEKDNLCVALGN